MKVKTATKKENSKKEIYAAPNEINLVERYGWKLVVGLLVAVFVVLFFDYLLGGNFFLFKDVASDTLNYSLPQYAHLLDYWKENGLPQWSFNKGIGQNIFPSSLGDMPNNLIFLFGRENLPYAFVFIQFFKIILAGIFFFQFFKKINISPFAASIGALLLSFSGFAIIGSQWYVFTTELLYTAMLLYALTLAEENNFILFPLTIALIAAYSPVLLFHASLISLAFVLYKKIIVANETINSVGIFSTKIIVLALLGVLMSAFLFYGNIKQMIDSPRGSGNVSYASALLSRGVFYVENGLFYQTAIMRFFSNDLMGYGNSFAGWNNYLEAPMQYVGLLCLLLVPQYFLLATSRHKKAVAVALTAVVLCFVFPFFRYSFWAFTGDYFRYFSLVVSVLILLIALSALDQIIKHQKINTIALFATGLAYTFLMLFLQKNEGAHQFVVILFLWITIAVLYLVGNQKISVNYLLLAVLAELMVVNFYSLNDRGAIAKDSWTQKTGYNGYTIEAVKYLHNIDSGFYRVHKDYSSGQSEKNSINDAEFQRFYSSLSYSSFNQKNYVSFLQNMGAINENDEYATRWLYGLRSRPLLMQLANNKYIISKGDSKWVENIGYIYMSAIDSFKLFKNSIPLPFGYTYSATIDSAEMKKLTPTGRDLMLMQAAVVDAAAAKKYNLAKKTAKDSIGDITLQTVINGMASLVTDTLTALHFSQNKITAKANFSGEKLVYFSIPFDEGWTLLVDDKKADLLKVNFGFMGCVLGKGEHTLQLSFSPKHFALTGWLSIAGMVLFVGFVGISWYLKNKKE